MSRQNKLMSTWGDACNSDRDLPQAIIKIETLQAEVDRLLTESKQKDAQIDCLKAHSRKLENNTNESSTECQLYKKQCASLAEQNNNYQTLQLEQEKELRMRREQITAIESQLQKQKQLTEEEMERNRTISIEMDKLKSRHMYRKDQLKTFLKENTNLKDQLSQLKEVLINKDRLNKEQSKSNEESSRMLDELTQKISMLEQEKQSLAKASNLQSPSKNDVQQLLIKMRAQEDLILNYQDEIKKGKHQKHAKNTTTSSAIVDEDDNDINMTNSSITQKDAIIHDLSNQLQTKQNDMEELVREFEVIIVERDQSIQELKQEKEALSKDLIDLSRIVDQLEGSNEKMRQECEIKNQLLVQFSRRSDLHAGQEQGIAI
ncbi:laminin subunit alpha [Acrasis kona]|uniref:Laminin subunit alpha n=1 Tax=Acrasis kona TaxID=1008807 RepID=A0AAW2YX90_9EUKA